MPKKARADYEKGYRLLEDQNKPADSIPAFEKAVAAYPSYYEAYTELGIADSHVGKASEAEASLKKAIELSDGQFLQPLYVLAEVYNNQGKYQAAEPLARQAIAFDNSSWNGFLELARAQLGLKRIGEAETSAQQARELAPQTPQVYLVLANVHAIQQKYQTAVQDLDVYLKLDPTARTVKRFAVRERDCRSRFRPLLAAILLRRPNLPPRNRDFFEPVIQHKINGFIRESATFKMR